MSLLISQVIPSLQIIKILGDTEKYEHWLNKMHPKKNSTELFEGFRFALNCCLNSFIDGLASDQLLGIKNDFLLDRAIAEIIPLHEIDNTCEKTILLKNIKSLVKAILKAKNYREIKENTNEFEQSVSSKFDHIIKENIFVSTKIKLNKETVLKLLLIDFVHTYLVQINNNGPTANFNNPLSPEWTKEERKNYYFEGYKYAIQFLWYELLGEEEFSKTHLSKIHAADSWRKYKYIEKEKSGNPAHDIFNKKFNLSEQNSFDSFFYWIKQEISAPLHKKYKFPLHTIDHLLYFSEVNYNKQLLFSDLLDSAKVKKTANMLSWSKKIKKLLYWYSFEIIDSDTSQIYLGTPSFNTMLAGTVTLHNPEESEFSKIIVAKFTHPLMKDGKKNDYSYGILIDTKSAAGYYSSGWVIYQNVCGDHSGFSGAEQKSTEKLILEYEKAEKIELRELTIGLFDFKEFTNQYTLDHTQISILEQNKLIPKIIQKSRAHLLELFTYYLCSKYYKGYNFDFNTDKKSEDGEKDVVAYNNDEVILIECKLNPQSYNMIEVLEKMRKKINTFSQKEKFCQLWFWYEPSMQNKVILDKAVIDDKSIEVIVLSNPRANPILKGVYLKQLKEIMQDYTINPSSFGYD
jgi:hypothetical protein